MPGVLLDRVVSVFRMTNNTGPRAGQTLTEIYKSLACAIVPISSFDAQQPYAYEATHVVWVPHWLVLIREDEIHYGRRPPDVNNNVRAEIFVVQGARRFTQSVSEMAFYVKEKL